MNDDDEAVAVVGSRTVGRTVEGEPTSVVNLDAPTDPHPEPAHDITPVAARRGRLRSTYGPSRHLARSELRESRERVSAISSEPVAERDRGSPYRLELHDATRVDTRASSSAGGHAPHAGAVPSDLTSLPLAIQDGGARVGPLNLALHDSSADAFLASPGTLDVGGEPSSDQQGVGAGSLTIVQNQFNSAVYNDLRSVQIAASVEQQLHSHVASVENHASLAVVAAQAAAQSRISEAHTEARAAVHMAALGESQARGQAEAIHVEAIDRIRLIEVASEQRAVAMIAESAARAQAVERRAEQLEMRLTVEHRESAMVMNQQMLALQEQMQELMLDRRALGAEERRSEELQQQLAQDRSSPHLRSGSFRV